MTFFSNSDKPEVKSIERYLSSGIIKGVGPSTAKKIVSHFGEDTQNIIENESDKLAQVDGIGPAKASSIGKSWHRNKGFNEVAIFLQKYDITIGMTIKIWQQYGKNAYEIIKTDPYRLSSDMTGVGFLSADRIAKSVGIAANSEMRAKAGLEHILNESMKNGSCCIAGHRLIHKASEDLNIDGYVLIEALKKSVAMGVFIMVDTVSNKRIKEWEFSVENNEETSVLSPNIFLSPYYHMERGIAKKLHAIQEGKSILSSSFRGSDKEIFNWLENRHGILLSDKQKEGVGVILRNKGAVITGGPGTGKTTMLSSLLFLLKNFAPNLQLKIKLAAPTGRAAKRMSESTGQDASTIHRLLEYDPIRSAFKHNASNPLRCDVVIVDEASMVDLKLMYSLVTALPNNCHLVLVGDVDQLPSVGPGAILSDIISSNSIPVIHLNQIFRQAATSDIVRSAHLINHGIMPKIPSYNERKDCWFVEISHSDDLPQSLVNLIKFGIGDIKGRQQKTFDPMSDVQVLAPMQKGIVGVKNLNVVLQKALNKNIMSGSKIEKFGFSYYVGDKVMQIENNYNKNVFNGDIGFIERINKSGSSAVISFDGRVIEYSFGEMGQIVHAYAITIHKSQGAEYPVVIIPITTQHFVMLNRNLIYTALTRAKFAAVFIGQKRALAIAVNNANTQSRNTMLSVWMKETQSLVSN